MHSYSHAYILTCFRTCGCACMHACMHAYTLGSIAIYIYIYIYITFEPNPSTLAVKPTEDYTQKQGGLRRTVKAHHNAGHLCCARGKARVCASFSGFASRSCKFLHGSGPRRTLAAQILITTNNKKSTPIVPIVARNFDAAAHDHFSEINVCTCSRILTRL